MASLIETLIGGSIVRKDDKRIAPTRRPLPERPRELLDVFSAMGGEASMANLGRSLELQGATARWLIAVVLNRWPTIAELQAQPEPYDARRHLSELIVGTEFRSLLAQRILNAFPEKRRMLFVRVPHCAGEHFLQLAQTMHPVFPNRLANPRGNAPRDYFATLGQHMGRYLHTRSVMLVQPRMVPFYKPAIQAAPDNTEADPQAGESLPWTMTSPPYRPSDRLFTIVRDPDEIILGQVNRIAAALQQSPEHDKPPVGWWRKRLATTGATDPKATARRVLALFPHANPICQALGDGTFSGALEACLITGVEIADLSRYDEWIVRTWDTKPEPAAPRPEPILARVDLTADDQARLATLTDQDRPLYARIRNAIDGATTSAVSGLRI